MANVSQWSTAAASNNATPPDGAPEGMARSSVNDVMRENMAGIARWYSDQDGSLTSAGTAAALTLTTNSSHAALVDVSTLTFRASVSASSGATLNVDGLGAKAIKMPGGGDGTGAVIANHVVTVVYNSTDDVFTVVSFGGDPVGTVKMTIDNASPVGWLLLNGDTIGSGASGATNAGAQYEALFTGFWNSMADAQAPVSTGRGASAAADFAANKTLTMPDARGRVPVMTGTGAGLTARTHGDDSNGAEDAIVPDHLHAVGTLATDAAGTHVHSIPADDSGGGATTQPSVTTSGNSDASPATNSTPDHTHPMSGSTASTGVSATDANMMPWLALNFIVKY